jgi:hypothetical protein
LITAQAICIPLLPHFYAALATQLLLASTRAFPCTYITGTFRATLALEVVLQVSFPFWRAMTDVAGAEVGLRDGVGRSGISGFGRRVIVHVH